MIRGIYSAASGMLAEQTVQNAIAANLANLNTVGYKQDVPTFRAYHEMALNRISGGSATPIGSAGIGVQFDRITTDFSAGPLSHTGNATDLAITGSGFFVVQTAGGPRYTRAGNFHLTATGELVNADNDPVMGVKGIINVPKGQPMEIGSDGSVNVNGKLVSRLQIVQVNPQNIQKQGYTLFDAPAGAVQPAKGYAVRQGYLEQSNVNPIDEMVQMIAVARAYDLAQRAITSQDSTLKEAASNVGQV
ncbi:MAG: flagellar basal-body rod protein FlgF [Armatimonadetes bacterium]|nr:flagellar basal-body rod protein FlgF [Armatimonadota bacterium]